MIEFIKLHIGEILFLLMSFAFVCSYIAVHIQIKARKKLFKEYEELVDEHEDVLSKFLAQSIEISSLYMAVEEFVNEHNSWHNRKIAFYYDKDGWHCLYADEIPQGDVVTEQEEINAQNEKEDEINQSI